MLFSGYVFANTPRVLPDRLGALGSYVAVVFEKSVAVGVGTVTISDRYPVFLPVAALLGLIPFLGM